MDTHPRPQHEFNPQRFRLIRRAAFLENSGAIDAFQQWNAQIDWAGHISADEYRLLPQLARNLAQQGFDHPLFAKFKGIARKTWYNNNLLFHALAPVLRDMQASGVESIILYGGALALGAANDFVLSIGGGIGVLIHPAHAPVTFARLAAAGWTPAPSIPERALENYLRARSFHTFQDKTGSPLFLQWQLLPACPAQNADAPFWTRAQTAVMDGVPVRVLEPTDQLIPACLYGATPRGSSPLQRGTDALFLLNVASAPIDWDAFIERTQSLCIVLPVRETLLPLADEFNLPIPAPILEKLKTLPISSDEPRYRILWDGIASNQRPSRLWQYYNRRSCAENALSRALQFPAFLQHYWALDNLFAIPAVALSILRRSRATA